MALQYIGAATTLLLLTSPLSAAPISFSVSPSLQYFHYQEFLPSGRVSNTESGFLPGVKGSARLAHERWQLEVLGAYFQNTVDYDGESTSGQPHQTRTDETLGQAGFSLSKTLNHPQYPSRFIFNHELRWWERDILPANGVLGLYELYRWQQNGLGVEQTLHQSGATQTLLGLQIFHVYDVEMEVNLFGTDVTFHPRPGNGFKAWFSWTFPWQQRRLLLSWFYQTFQFKSSELHLVNTPGGPQLFAEPDSTTQLLGMELTIPL
ncbi:MAG: hypothetical protein OEZ68_20875 [Gammaproteobacteria bacterium]|nr:hypothetical protein [Gammaproteobacteria bacterium]MDH5803256.1 hypothetical protein [Gammaproteobacteria bacterium]